MPTRSRAAAAGVPRRPSPVCVLSGITSTEPATNLASSIDPIALERDPETQRDRSQVSRLRTAWQRESRDDRRATPAPMAPICR
mgnify:CR=1 FL=1